MTGKNAAYNSATLSSGVEVVGQQMSGVESVAVGILVGAGARDEDGTHAGLGHFTEQMLFRGTHSMDARQLSDRLDALGIDYDSSSGIEMSMLHAVLLGRRLPEALDLLSDVARSPAFPEDALENVRTLLLQELRQREDRPAQKVLDLLRRTVYAGSSLGNDVLGTEESLQRLSREDLVDFWTQRYVAANMTISIAGNFDWDRALEQLNRITSPWPRGDRRRESDAPDSHATVTVVVRDTAQEHLGFAFPGVAVADPDYYAAVLLAQAFGGGANARLHQEVREKRGLAYAANARFDGLESTGLFRVYVGTSADRAHESVEVVMAELEKLERDGLTAEELDLAKTRVKSSLIMRSESSAARMGANARSWWFERRLRDLDELRDRIDAVTLDAVSELIARLGITRNLASVALGPRSEDELFGAVLSRT